MQISLDKTELLEKVFGDKDMLAEIIDMFLELSPTMLDAIDQTIQVHDAKKLSETAHTLKGSIGNFTIDSPFQAALELENIGKSENLGRANEAFAIMKNEIDMLNRALIELKTEF